MAPTRDWREARAKVACEGACRVCRALPGERRGHRIVTVEAAHVAGRRYDTGVVRACDVVPLCGPFGDSTACHTRYDHGELSLLPFLSHAEQVAVVEHLGLTAAWKRVTRGG